MNITISVVVPVYNAELYLCRCIESIMNQTYQNIEIILVNDGSTDGSGKICDDYCAKYNSIKAIHKQNGGPGAARNTGIAVAQGKYLGFVDADDFIESDMYEKLLKACIETDAPIGTCGRYDYYKDGRAKPVFTRPNQEVWTGEQAIGKLLVWNDIDCACWDKLFLKELFDRELFPVENKCEDIILVPKIVSESTSVVHIGVPKYYYFQREGSKAHSGFSERYMNDMLEAHKIVSDFVKIKYPALHKESNTYYIVAVLGAYLTFYSNKAANRVAFIGFKQKIDRLARLNFFAILKNKHILVRDKLYFIFGHIGLYAGLKSLKNFIIAHRN